MALKLMSVLVLLAIGSAVLADECTCGPFKYPDPSTKHPPGPYIKGRDVPGNDMDPCGSQGCKLDLKTTYLDCESLCNKTAGCVAYVFSEQNCDTPAGSNVCWLKSSVGVPVFQKCRNYRVVHPVASGPFCPLVTEWGSQVSLDETPLPEYPRPQMVRGDARTWLNLNGKWEFQPATAGERPRFGQPLNSSILVPFPAEACLSGIWANHPYLFYRKVFTAPWRGQRTLIHFGAVDWQTTVYANGRFVGNHTGGYDGFTFDLTPFLTTAGPNELFVTVFDPSDFGAQVFGKQRVSAIRLADGDTYTPASGIWQTVWLETVPSTFIERVTILGDLSSFTVSAFTNIPGQAYQVQVLDGATVVASGSGTSNGATVKLSIAAPKLWHPDSPFLYNISFTIAGDTVLAYGGLRTFALGKDEAGVTRPLLNGKFLFLAGWLDQSYWPDGIYTAPSDAALRFDLESVHTFGLNMVRLHQKVNSERWYYHADTLGIVVLQDMVQHYGDPHGNPPDPVLFHNDFVAMIDGRYNHPCIVQWTAFNEGDMVAHFDAASVVAWAKAYDPSRLVDTDSGGPANDLHVGDVNDIHDYPWPKDPKPSASQYAMIGEFGGVGAFIPGHEWWPGLCQTYLKVADAAAEASTYIQMVDMMIGNKKDLSVSVYTQITDVERECDGFLNYDRTNKFTAAQTQAIAEANRKLIEA